MKCRGMALLTGLLLMAAVSLLAVTAAGGMTLQRQQAANHEDKVRAANRAALAESHAMAWLASRADVERESGCSTNCLLPAGIHRDDEVPDRVAFEPEPWWRARATAAGAVPVTGEPGGFAVEVDSQALWLIEEIHFEAQGETEAAMAFEGVGYYRVLARGRGLHPRSVAVSESIVARPWGGDFEPAAYPPEAPRDSFCGQFDAALPCGRLAWRERR